MNWLDRPSDLDAWRLDQEWDVLVGRNVSPVSAPVSTSAESTLPQALRWFQAAGGMAEPNVAFVARLEEELMASGRAIGAGAEARSTPAPVTPGPRPVAAIPTVAAGREPEVKPHAWRSWPILDVAAMLLIAAGIVAVIAVQNDSLTLPWRDGNPAQPVQQIGGGPATTDLPIAAATPAATPEPAECTVEPRSIEEVISIVGIANPAQWDEPYYRSFPSATTTDVRPTGTPAPPDIVAEIQFTVDQWLACAPYDTYLSGMQFSSEAAIRRDLNMPLTSDIIAALQDPDAFPQLPFLPTGIVIENAELLPDGRVVVDARAVFPPGSGIPESDTTGPEIMVKEDGLWRFDETVDTTPDGGFVPGTPDSGFTRAPLDPTGTPSSGA